jgi:hypothetical protein
VSKNFKQQSHNFWHFSQKNQEVAAQPPFLFGLPSGNFSKEKQNELELRLFFLKVGGSAIIHKRNELTLARD